MRTVVTLAMAALATLLGGVTFAAVEGAAATSCAATITISGPTQQSHLVLTPSSVKVGVGECVAFTNSASSQVSVSVTSGGSIVYTATLERGATASGRAGFTPKVAGKAAVSASGRPLLPVLPKPTGSASITVSTAPPAKPTSSGSPAPTGKHGGNSAGQHPKVASKPKHKHAKGNGPTAKPTGIKLPPLPPLPVTGITSLPRASVPLVAPGPHSPAAITNSPSPVAAVIGGPLEPTGDNRRGLPVAIGVLVVLGMVTGWGRVLLAQPGAVDNRPSGSHRL